MKIIIVGAGPGGLAAGMLLAHGGHEVHIFEKADQPGGRTSEIRLKDFRFDVGPTFLMMKFVLDEIFTATGRKSDDYLDFMQLPLMYRLQFGDRHLDIHHDRTKTEAEIKRVFGESGEGLKKFLRREKKRYDNLMPILLAHNNQPLDALRWRFLRSIPHFAIGRSIYSILGDYFRQPDLKTCFTFQSKYLGMSPWNCPGAFTIVPYVEHSQGVYHVRGGLSEISRQMARAIEEDGGQIHYDTPIRKIVVQKGRAVGVELEGGELVKADRIVLNADFGHAVENLFDDGVLRKHSPQKLVRKDLSCSIFMLYLGLNKQYKLNHNTIVLANNYRKNVEDIFGGQLTERDISFYVRDHSTTDPTLAPEGKTALYVLVPVPNCRADIDWSEAGPRLREQTLDALENRLGLSDIRSSIEVEKMVTPADWRNSYNVYEGAVFNLSHRLRQMLWFRPHNRFEDVKNVYLTGGGTHPGSGLPTIWHSGRLAAELIDRSSS
ncbi:MAG: phytoene desaturase family protein [bacterium]